MELINVTDGVVSFCTERAQYPAASGCFDSDTSVGGRHNVRGRFSSKMPIDLPSVYSLYNVIHTINISIFIFYEVL